MPKANLIIDETLDERGRCISAEEFNWLMNYFRDRYDPRRLSFALMYVTGLRHQDGISARLSWFDQGLTSIKMSQCKPSITKKDGITRMKSKPRFVPLPGWLSHDLKNYIKYRLAVGVYAGGNIEDLRLFPTLKKSQHRQWLQKLRLRYGKQQPWLMDLWKITKGYDEQGNLLWIKRWFRIACHAPRSNYCTAAYNVCDKDLLATKVLSGHTQTKDVERYVKVANIMDKKQEVCDRYMAPLCSRQSVPLLIGQRKLTDFESSD